MTYISRVHYVIIFADILWGIANYAFLEALISIESKLAAILYFKNSRQGITIFAIFSLPMHLES